MKVKICGITRLEDARYSAGAGADYLGFIQYPDSPRYVPPDTAKEIISWVHGPAPVGVFVDTDPDDVNRVADRAGFALVQLHGNETPADCEAVDVPVIKAIKVGSAATTDQLRRRMDAYRDVVSYFLLDTKLPGMAGGTGVTFDWDVAASLSEEYPLFLAGGLSPDNVAEAIDRVQPFAVDVSSGVESAPGIKDFDRLNAFLDAVRIDGD